MATVIRKTDPMVQHLADAHNDLKAQIGAGASFHLDKSEVTVTAANATDLPSAVVLVNQTKYAYNFHCADSLALKAVDAAVETSADANPNAGDGGLAAAIALANDIKAKYNTHIASATIHYNADATNAVAAANATDLASLETLANAIKTAFNAHVASGPSAKSLRVVSG